MDMAKETFRVLKELCRDAEVGGKGQCGQPLDWNQISSTIQKFVAYEPEVTGQIMFGGIIVENVTSKGYNAKIRILDPAFGLTPREQSDRDRAAREYDRFIKNNSSRVTPP
jgi:hypothetical protein